MSLIVKIMSGDDNADDARTTFTIFSGVKQVTFMRDDEDDDKAVAALCYGVNDEELIEVHDRAYVMNEAGKTISTFVL